MSKVSKVVKFDYDMFFMKKYNMQEVIRKTRCYNRNERIALVDIILKETSMTSIADNIATKHDNDIPDNFLETDYANSLISLVHNTENVTPYSVLFVCMFPMKDDSVKRRSGRKLNPLPNSKELFRELYFHFSDIFPNLQPLSFTPVQNVVPIPTITDNDVVEKIKCIVKTEVEDAVGRLILVLGNIKDEVSFGRKQDHLELCEHINSVLKQRAFPSATNSPPPKKMRRVAV
jgi:hypothetical protein